jgi:hypothetical protein
LSVQRLDARGTERRSSHDGQRDLDVRVHDGFLSWYFLVIESHILTACRRPRDHAI